MLKLTDFTFDNDLLSVIIIAPTIANNNIREVIINNTNKLVYKILPKDVICVICTKVDSQLSVLTLPTDIDGINPNNNLLPLIFVEVETLLKTVLYSITLFVISNLDISLGIISLIE